MQSVLQVVGNSLSQQQAKYYLQNMVRIGAISRREGTTVMAAVSDRALAKIDSDVRSVVRSDIFKNTIVSLMLDQ